MKTTIYLIRHGVTAANKNDLFAGRTQEPLHPEGESQLLEVGKRLALCAINKIFSGPLARTRQSAGIVGDLLSVPVEAKDALNEIRIPHWDGLTKEMIRARFASEYPTWLADPAGFSVSGCETIAEVQGRAVAFIESLCAEFPGQTLLVVSHLIVVRALLLHYLARPLGEFRAIKVGNAQVVTLVRDDTGGTTVEM
ncbi:histidine phosphatase family protein [Thiovibrio frasassiensis]|uniref:Histidine phosphatase family protein n=1 Tax=Thiovibrio frasassiensis TaxID=2984131 RepID=A0A9X4MGX4_9BACT|nr:histidine phosphatase family protein [Thiovibrio frasassiensis]MDG4475675.1 histidine phosphatase family protein [Thiovibrio frasassiensis]